jgi:Arc/MetJ family transcription regulator
VFPHSHFHVTFDVDGCNSRRHTVIALELAVIDVDAVGVVSPDHVANVIQLIYAPNRYINIHMIRTNLDTSDSLVKTVMMRYNLNTKREAVDHALRHLVGMPLSTKEIGEMFGAFPDFEIPSNEQTDENE